MDGPATASRHETTLIRLLPYPRPPFTPRFAATGRLDSADS